MATAAPLSVLLLCDFDPFNAQMVQDSIHALARGSRHAVRCLSFRRDLPESLDLARFDAIAIHYSSFVHDDRYVSPGARRRIAAFGGAKAAFLHDEYKHVNRTKQALAELGVGVLFTCFEPPEARQVYGDLIANGLRTISVLPGYVPPALAALDPGPTTALRPIDIGYRGRAYPAWHGELGQDRVRIHQRVSADAPRFNLVIDSSVSERDRLYGRKWLAFQRRCKMVLGTESGASVVDFTGEIASAVDAHLAASPGASFDELRRLYFAALEDRHPLRTMSPRIFEAAACGCGLILYEGSYAGRLKAGRHYLPLARDHANFGDIVALMREPGRIDALARAAREEVLLAPENQEKHLVASFDEALASLGGPERAPGYEQAEFRRLFGAYDAVLAAPVLKRQLFRVAHATYGMATSPLPAAVERRLSAAVRAAYHRILGR